MSWLGILSLVPFALLLLAVMIIIVLDAAGGDYGKRKVGEIFSSVYKLFHRPSLLQREIMQEEKEIKQLEAQKADIRRLEELKRKREALFKEESDKHVERVEDQSDERVRVTVDGCQIPHIFSSKELANDYVENFHPKAKEIEMRGRFTL